MAQPFTIPYRSLSGERARPYLVMAVTGVNGATGPVPGLVDSGADSTSFPFGYATLMGYTPNTLTPQNYAQVGGTGTGFLAKQPCTAIVPEIPGVVVEMHPMFVPGAQLVLWGRQDFMRRFDVTIMETRQHFSILPLS